MNAKSSLILLSLTAAVSLGACSSDNDDDNSGDNPNTGGSASGGMNGDGDGTGSGGMNGDGDGTGSGGMAAGGMGGMGGGDTGPACTSTVKAAGPMMGAGGAANTSTRSIDDFDANESPWLPEVDGRNGTWSIADFLVPVSDMNTEATDPQLEKDGENYFLKIACAAEDTDAACNTAWSKDTPFQWAAATIFPVDPPMAGDTPCYDASVYSGISFKARAATAGQKIRVQFNTPSDDRINDISFNSAEITLTNTWETYDVNFADITLGDSSKKLDPSEIQAISFTIRNVSLETDGGVQGESLDAYDIDLDEVAWVD